VYNKNINQSAIERNASIISLIVEKREEKEKNLKFEVAVVLLIIFYSIPLC
jgi:hypothetical protein